MPMPNQVPEQQVIIDELRHEAASPEDQAYLDQLQIEHDTARSKLLDVGESALKAIDHEGVVLTPRDLEEVKKGPEAIH